MLVIPAGTARMLTNSIGRMIWLAPALGASFGVVGMYASWHVDVPSGAMITIVAGLAFGVVFVGTDVSRRRLVAALDDHSVMA